MNASPRAGLVVALALVACSSSNHGTASNATSTPTNSIDFPLFDGATVLSARTWTQKVSANPGAGDNAVFVQGGGTYDGHDVVAGTQALMPSLEGWLASLQANPPAGYTVAMQSDTVQAVRNRTRDLGVDFAVFERTENGKRRGLVALAVDPDTLNAKAGPMLGAIGRFKYLPQSLRDSIDVAAKKQTGFTISEAANPDTPIGAAVGALAQLRDFGGRGVVLIDAVKQ